MGAAVAESMGSRLVAHKTVVLCLRHGAPLPSLFVALDPCTSHAGAGGARSRAISIRMSLNMSRDSGKTPALALIGQRSYAPNFCNA
jgi:hypothetical protein